jgi:hypothetical protein
MGMSMDEILYEIDFTDINDAFDAGGINVAELKWYLDEISTQGIDALVGPDGSYSWDQFKKDTGIDKSQFIGMSSDYGLIEEYEDSLPHGETASNNYSSSTQDQFGKKGGSGGGGGNPGVSNSSLFPSYNTPVVAPWEESGSDFFDSSIQTFDDPGITLDPSMGFVSADDLVEIFPDLLKRENNETQEPKLNLNEIATIMSDLWRYESNGDLVQGQIFDVEKSNYADDMDDAREEGAVDAYQLKTGLSQDQLQSMAQAMGIMSHRGGETIRLPGGPIPMKFPLEKTLSNGQTVEITESKGRDFYEDNWGDTAFEETDEFTVALKATNPNIPQPNNDAKKYSTPDTDIIMVPLADNNGNISLVAMQKAKDTQSSAAKQLAAEINAQSTAAALSEVRGKNISELNTVFQGLNQQLSPKQNPKDQTLVPQQFHTKPLQQAMPGMQSSFNPSTNVTRTTQTKRPFVNTHVERKEAKAQLTSIDSLMNVTLAPQDGTGVTLEYPSGIQNQAAPYLEFTPMFGGTKATGFMTEDYKKVLKQNIQNIANDAVSDNLLESVSTILSSANPFSSAGSAIMDTAKGAGKYVGRAFNKVMQENLGGLGTRSAGDLGATIVLYVPEGFEMANEAQWASEDGSVIRNWMANVNTPGSKFPTSDAFSSVMKSFGDTFQEGAGKDLLAARGLAKKNNRSVMFNGIGFREFSINFNFVPKSANEYNDVRKIITNFRKLMLPKKHGSGSTQWVLPGYYKIDLRNTALVFNSYWVLTNCRVGYGSEGRFNVAGEQGTPTQMSLHLSFIETRQQHMGDVDPSGV